MAKNDNELLQELKKISEQLAQQEQRIKELETVLQSPSQKQEEKKPFVRPLKEPSKEKVRDWRSLELTIGKYWLQTLGVVVFALGALFFVRYAIQHDVLSPLLQVVLGLAIATGFIAVSGYVWTRYQLWSRATFACGIILYYLSIFAASSYYHLIPQPLALVGFGIVSFGSLSAAVYYNSLNIAYLSFFGGFITVYSSMTGTVLEVSYFLVLAAAALIVALKNSWYSLAYLSAFCTFIAVEFGSFSVNIEMIGLLGMAVLYCLVCSYYGLMKDRGNTVHDAVLLFLANQIAVLRLYEVLYHTSSMRETYFVLTKGIFGGSGYSLFTAVFLIMGTLYFIGFLLTRNVPVRPVTATLLALTVSCYGTVAVSGFMPSYEAIRLLVPGLVFLAGLWFLVRREVILFISLVPMSILILMSFLRGPFLWDGGAIALFVPICTSLVLMGILMLASYLTHEPNKVEYDTSFSALTLAGAFIAPLFVIATIFEVQLIPSFEALLAAGYGAVVVLMSFIYRKRLLYYVGAFSLLMSLFYTALYYVSFDLSHINRFLPPLGQLSILSYTLLFAGLIVLFSLFFFALALIPERGKLEGDARYVFIRRAVSFVIGALLFLLVRLYIIFVIHYYELFQSARAQITSLLQYFIQPISEASRRSVAQASDYREYALTVYYGITAFLLIIGGLAYKDSSVRFIGLFLFLITLLKLGSIIHRMPDTGMRIGAFLLVGALLIIASYIYQRLSKREEAS